MDSEMAMGTPWLDQPLMLHSSRAYECSLNATDQCAYQQGYWRFWYQADHRYALPTIAFFMTAITLAAIAHLLLPLLPSTLKQTKSSRQLAAFSRYFSYRNFRLDKLNWNSAPLGVLFLGAVGAIFFFSMTLGPKPYYWPWDHEVSFGDSPPLATRSGWMSLACLPLVIATAGKSNLITMVTGVSHERLQPFHRWISYAMFVLALIHTFPFIVFNVWNGDMMETWRTSVAYWTGVVALLAQSWLTFASFGPLRALCYEWFKFAHFVAGIVFVVFFFIHCDFTLSSSDYFIATGVLYSLSWLHRGLRIYFEHGTGHRAQLSLMSNGFVRVSVPTPSSWHVGQHYFVRFLSLGLHAYSTHPFTACSLPDRSHPSEILESDLIFYIRPQGGFTAALAKQVENHPKKTIRILLDGPYGGIEMHQVASVQRAVIVAGGSGAGWALPLIIAFLRRLELKSQDSIAIRVILATRDLATQEWFEDAVAKILASSSAEKASDISVQIYYTGSSENRNAPQATGQFLSVFEEPEKVPMATTVSQHSDSSSSSSSSVKAKAKMSIAQRMASRPHLPSIIEEEAARMEAGSSMGVFICGPLSMQSDAANAVARQQLGIVKDGTREISLHMEHFSWA